MNRRTFILALAFAALFSAVTYAVNPVSPFRPADNIQDPTCLPTDSNCYVTYGLTTQSNATTLYTDTKTINFGSGLTAVDDGDGVVTVTASTATPLVLRTDGVDNGSQDTLNLVAGANIDLTDNGSGGLTIATTDTLTAGNLNITGNSTTVNGPTDLSAEQGGCYDENYNVICTSGFSDQWVIYRVYAYKNFPEGRVYSSTYTGITLNDCCDADHSYTLSWSAAQGVDGYRILRGQGPLEDENYDPLPPPAGYGEGHDVVGLSYFDDDRTYNGTTFSAGSTAITPTVSDPNNSATINGILNLSGPLVMQDITFDATSSHVVTIGTDNTLNGSNNFFVGDGASEEATSVSNGNFIGYEAGKNATSAANSNFFGNSAGYGATDAVNSNFFGSSAGRDAVSAYQSNFFGPNAGETASGAYRSNFMGYLSGNAATDAYNSNFFGYSAGNGAISARNSNFLGDEAGLNASSANSSNFFGPQAGRGAVSANSSNFIGSSTGYNATSAANSNFIGGGAGYSAANASNSNFFGNQAGFSATNATNSIFMGQRAGYFDTVNNAASNNWSILIGPYTNTGGFQNSILLGGSTSTTAISNTAANQFMLAPTITSVRWRSVNYTLPSAQGAAASYLSNNGSGTLSWAALQWVTNSSNVYYNTGNVGIGTGTTISAKLHSLATTEQLRLGYNAANYVSTTVGSTGGVTYDAIGAGAKFTFSDAVQIGAYTLPTLDGTSGNILTTNGSGVVTWNAPAILVVGTTNLISTALDAGLAATSPSNSIFLGVTAGESAITATKSNFIGFKAGSYTTNVTSSNFLGNEAGAQATNASNSNFIGISTGFEATNASNSNFIGVNAGSLAANARNSIFIGSNAGSVDSVNNTGNTDNFSILLGNNTSTGGFSNSIALGAYATNTSSNQFMIGSTTRPIDEIVVVQSGGTECIIDTSGLGCTSDENLKTNIEDLGTDILAKLSEVRTVSYNWKNNPDANDMIGFIAQNLEPLFPELVSTNDRGQKSVYYAQMAPILTKAIQEMNLNMIGIGDLEQENGWRDALIGWFEKSTNGIRSLVVKDKVCVDDQCLTNEDIRVLLEIKNSLRPGVPPSSEPEVVTPIDEPGEVIPEEIEEGAPESETVVSEPEPEAEPEPLVEEPVPSVDPAPVE